MVRSAFSLLRPRRFAVRAALLTAVVFGIGSPWGPRAVAQGDDEPLPPAQPLIVVNVASIERLLDDMDYMFRSASRPELTETVTGLLGNVNDLEGLVRNKPFGVFVFLKPGLAPTPTPVGYFPVDDIEELAETVGTGPIVLKASPDEADRYELIGPNQTLQVKLRGGYAFVAFDLEILDREMPDPEEATRQLATRYDFGIRIDVDSIPEAMKTLFVGLLRANAAAEMAQRDGEPEVRYRLRKARGERDLEFIESMLLQGDSLTIGWDASPEKKRGVLEVNVKAQPDSKLAKMLRDIGGEPSRFAPLIGDSSPLTASASLMISERDRQLAVESLEAMRVELTRRLAEGGENEGASEPVPDRAVDLVIASLRSTAERGHLDGILKIDGDEPGKFALYGGMKVLKAGSLSDGLTDILRRLQARPEATALEALKLDAAEHAGIRFHRYFIENPDDGGKRLFGDEPSVYLGVGRQAIWFAVGGDGVFGELARAIDTVSEGTDGESKPAAPFRLVTSMSTWTSLPSDAGNEREERRAQTARDAFRQGNDQLKVDVRPTETGLRMQVTLDEGFIRYLGLGTARQFDRRATRESERRQRSRDNPERRRDR